MFESTAADLRASAVRDRLASAESDDAATAIATEASTADLRLVADLLSVDYVDTMARPKLIRVVVECRLH